MSTRSLIIISCLLAFIVITLGAYVRLSDAGLGCPDWPGCYGQMVVPSEEQHIDEVNELYPERPVEGGKAWKEMIHRYAAGFLLLLVITITYRNFVDRKNNPRAATISYFLLALIIFQALLGMWTVTLLLKPVVVMSHLLGGMTVFLLLAFLLHNAGREERILSNSKWFPFALLALIIVYLQIFLGGWTSANYAALVCSDFPTCQNSWWPTMDFENGFTFWTGLGRNYEFGLLEPAARTAIHFTHRIGAVVTLIVVGTITALAVVNTYGKQKWFAGLSLVLLIIQLILGILNIILVLPIGVAVAHNGVAALLLISVGSFLYYSLPNRSR